MASKGLAADSQASISEIEPLNQAKTAFLTTGREMFHAASD